ncbi:MAG: hypothetical protein IT305_05035 [Chloroflexi bacterium]|nr:hypothetical protein [Chloroflexota bacterium]
MDDGSQNGHQTGDEETPEEHRATHLQNLLEELLTVMVEDATDDEDLDGVIDTALLSLVEVVGTRAYRLPRPLVEALAAWVGAEARGYLRSVYADEHGHLDTDTPDAIARYLTLSDEQYWPDE